MNCFIVQKEMLENLYDKTHSSIKFIFLNKEEEQVGEACVDYLPQYKNGFVYQLKISPKYRGLNYGNFIMRYLIKNCNVTEFMI